MRRWCGSGALRRAAFLERLGAIARRYHVNQYGLTSSPLQGGLPSDRLVAEWWLKSQRVESLLDDVQKSEFKQKFETVKSISVPGQIYEWKASVETRERAREVQERNRKDFLQAFNDDLTVLGYERDSQGDGKFLLGHWNENWNYSS